MFYTREMEEVAIEQNAIQTEEKPKVKFNILYPILGVLLSIGLFIFSIQFFNNGHVQSNNSQQNVLFGNNKKEATPTPLPLRELTIPYLREREYKSNLGEETVYSENGTYTSYLTSYDSDGLQINGLLTRPTGEMPDGGWPAIVFVHGYIPPTQYQTPERYVDYVDYLARNGFVVFKIDLRGHGNSEGQPGGAYYSADYVIDTLNAYSALQNDENINPKKIGLWGHSMAGNVLMRSIAARPNIPAAVIWGGAGFTYTDLQEYGITDASYQRPASPSPGTTGTANANRRQRIRDLYGEPGTDNSFWKQMTPTNYLDEYKGALELHHAVDDETVSVEYSRNLKKILEKTSVPHGVYEYPSGGHDISGTSFVEAMERSVAFYKKYLTK